MVGMQHTYWYFYKTGTFIFWITACEYTIYNVIVLIFGCELQTFSSFHPQDPPKILSFSYVT